MKSTLVNLPISILSRSFRLVFAQPIETIKVSAPGLLIACMGIALMYRAGGGIHAVEAGNGRPVSWSILFALLAMTIAGFMKFAICWHRHALLSDGQRKDVMKPTPAIYGQYFKAAAVVTLLMATILLIGVLGAGFAILHLVRSLDAPDEIADATLSIVVAPVFYWTLLRTSLTLPAAATDRRMRLRESWQATRNISYDIFWTAILLGLIDYALEEEAIAVSTTFPALALSMLLVLAAIQSLIYVSVLSTLYGHLIEGRPLD